MNEWRKTYDISNGDETIKLLDIEKGEHILSVQVDSDSNFDGTTTSVFLVQSNVLTRNIAHWHPLPEAPLTMLVGAESALLNTFSFTAKFAALVIVQGDATAGILSITGKYKR